MRDQNDCDDPAAIRCGQRPCCHHGGCERDAENPETWPLTPANEALRTHSVIACELRKPCAVDQVPYCGDDGLLGG